MKRWTIALIAAFLSLTTGAGLATAAVPSLGSQTVNQSASSGQVAGAAAGAAQTNPSNTNVSIRVLSPGNDGSVSQSNSADSDATASNRNSADQDATQSQSAGSTGACCGSGSTGIQSSSQTAANQQAAAALSLATQTECVEHERAGAGREPGERRLGVPVEQRRLRCIGVEPQLG